MPDKVTLLVDNKRIENFLSYRVESNLFEAADAFSLELANPEIEIAEGMDCKLKVNDLPELTGIIDRITENYDKQTHTLTVEGRDLMGLLVDSHVETEFKTLKNTTLKELAEQLLKNVPFIDRSKIIFGKGDKSRVVPIKEQAAAGIWSQPKEFMQIDVGDTVFEVLKRYALADGLLFFAVPDGTFVFGEPVTSGTAAYTIMTRKNGRKNNIIRGNRTRDISGRYSRVIVQGQQQGTNLFSTQEINKSGFVEDPDFQFCKPFVSPTDVAGVEPKEQAELIMRQQKFDGLALEYVVQGHSQAEKNYQPNSIIHVIDEVLKPPIKGDFLIYARTFEQSKAAGTTTTLKLSELGVLPT